MATSGKANYFTNKYFDWLLRNQTYTPATTIYIALFTTTPTAIASSGTEVTGGSYARQPIVCGLTTICGTQSAGSTAVSSGTGTSGLQVSNNAAITFPTCTVGWGTVNGFAIFDAITSGNCLYFAPLTTPQTIAVGNIASWAISALVVNEV